MKATYGKIQLLEFADRRSMWLIDAAPHVTIRLKRLFPRAKTDRAGRVELFESDEVARDLAWFLERYPMRLDHGTARTLQLGAAAHREAEDATAAILAGRQIAYVAPRESAQPSRPYQLQAADLVTVMRRLLVTDALGLGKSHTGLLTLRNTDSLPALIVVPTNLTFQWQRQAATLWPGLSSYIPTKGTPDTHFHRWTERNGGPPDIFIVPYSKLRGWQHHLAPVVRTVLLDEAQELRNGIYTEKGTAAANVCRQANYVVGLTATPVYNYGAELHSIYDIVAPDALGSRDEFLREWGGREWAQPGGRRVATVADPKALSVYLRSSGLMIGRTRAEVSRELPYGDVEKVPHVVDSDLAVLDDLAGDAVDLARIILDSATSQQDKWKAAGELDRQMRLATGLAKAPYVAAFVQSLIEAEATDKVVLWGWHHAVYDVWTEQLEAAGIRVARYTGTESVAGKERAVASFLDTSPFGADVLIMSLRSGAGLDGLQEACAVGVFGELDWSPKIMDQCSGRLARDGQQAQVVAYYLTSDSGADPEMLDRLNIKEAQAKPIEDPSAVVTAALPEASRIDALARGILARARNRRRAPNAARHASSQVAL